MVRRAARSRSDETRFHRRNRSLHQSRAPKRTSVAGAGCGLPSRTVTDKTVTLIAGLRLRGLTAARTFDGPINAALFEDWVETCLVPTLSPGEIVVMDNLPAHKGPRVEQLIKAAGAQLRYLPAYSPDMNPIVKAFSKLKAFLRKIAERTVAGLLRALETCAEIFKPSECTNYFKSCGYRDDTG